MWAVSEGSLEACQRWRAVTPAHRAGRTAGRPKQLSGPWMEQPFGLGRSGTRLRWPPVLVCLGLQGFPGCRTCRVQIGKVPGKSLSWGSSSRTGPCGFLERVISGPGSRAVCTCSPHPSLFPLLCSCVRQSLMTYVLPYSRSHVQSKSLYLSSGLLMVFLLPALTHKSALNPTATVILFYFSFH